MKILKITSATNFKQENHKNHEFIDYLSEKVRNKRDVDDCIAIPRGIFKAYIYLMAGSSLMLTAAALPAKCKIPKKLC